MTIPFQNFRILFIASLLLFIMPAMMIAQNINLKDAEGKKNGKWEGYYENGNLRYTGIWDHGERKGEFRHFFEDGKLKAVLFFYNHGKKSRAILFDEKQKKLAEGFYTEKKRDSIWVIYDAKNEKIIAKERYRNTYPHGTWLNYYPNSEVIVKETNYLNGLKSGYQREYFETGQKKSEVFYKADTLTGPNTTWNPDGSISMTGQYKNNVRDGSWEFFDENGKTNLIDVYFDGYRIYTNYIKGDSIEYHVPMDVVRQIFPETDSSKNDSSLQNP